MGLLTYDALVITKVVTGMKKRSRVLTLGVPTLNFKSEDFVKQLAGHDSLLEKVPANWEFSDHVGFFKGLGCETIDSLDISSYEGANVIGDLNDPSLADQIEGQYDLIYDSGTVEHIFDAPTALRTLASLLSVGGAIVHATPTNGFMDHGLWQLSPDLFRAFYRAAGFSILTSAVFVFADPPYAVKADENFYRRSGRKYIVENFSEALAIFAAVKKMEVAPIKIEMQDYYKSMHDAVPELDSSAFFIEFGSRVPAPAPSMPASPAPIGEAISNLASSVWAKFQRVLKQES